MVKIHFTYHYHHTGYLPLNYDAYTRKAFHINHVIVNFDDIFISDLHSKYLYSFDVFYCVLFIE